MDIIVRCFACLCEGFANLGLAAGAGGTGEVRRDDGQDGGDKPSQRTEGAMALVIAATAAADPAAEKEATKENVWGDALKSDATYFATATIAKLGWEDSEVLARCGTVVGSPLVAPEEGTRVNPSTDGDLTAAASHAGCAHRGEGRATRGGEAGVPAEDSRSVETLVRRRRGAGGFPVLTPGEDGGDVSSSTATPR